MSRWQPTMKNRSKRSNNHNNNNDQEEEDDDDDDEEEKVEMTNETSNINNFNNNNFNNNGNTNGDLIQSLLNENGVIDLSVPFPITLPLLLSQNDDDDMESQLQMNSPNSANLNNSEDSNHVINSSDSNYSSGMDNDISVYEDDDEDDDDDDDNDRRENRNVHDDNANVVIGIIDLGAPFPITIPSTDQNIIGNNNVDEDIGQQNNNHSPSSEDSNYSSGMDNDISVYDDDSSGEEDEISVRGVDGNDNYNVDDYDGYRSVSEITGVSLGTDLHLNLDGGGEN